MTDRFYKDIEVPNLAAGDAVPTAPDAGFIQIYGRDGKLVVKAPGVSAEQTLTPVSGVYATPVTVQDTTDSTDTATGALVVAGGIGVGGSISIGGNINIPGVTPTTGQVITKTETGLTWSTPSAGGGGGGGGWSPTFAVAADGTRSVLQVVDWVGGEGTKPVTGKYVGAAGFVTLITEAADIRGLKGDEGDSGPVNSLSIGTVVAGVSASATISGTAPAQELNLVLPKGDTGPQGIQGEVGPVGPQGLKGGKGDTGDNGAAATIAVGTVTTGAPGSSAIITNVGTSSAAVFDFTIPRGDTGSGGSGSGDVVGPAASVDNEVALFDGATGKVIKGGGVLNTGAYAEQDRWKLQAFNVMAIFQGAAPTWALGSYYPQSDVLVANGNTVIRGSTGDIYTMAGGVWVLTNPFDANSNGSRIAYAQTGDLGPFLWTRSAGVTTRTLMQQSSGNIRYSEGTAGVDFTNYSVRSKLDEIGRLINLTTADKASIVAAINELVSSKLGDAPMNGKTYGRKDADWEEVVAGDVTQTGTQTLTNKTIHGNVNTLTVDGTNEVGFRHIPQNSQSAAYTLGLADAGKHVLHPAADTTARTFTIPANSAVAFPIGTAITFINQNGTGGVVAIAITSDIMRLAGAGTTGSRTLARNGVATAIKIAATEWIISGTGLT